MSRVLRRADGLNMSNSCVFVAFLFLITRTSVDQSTFVGYPLEDCRRYPVDIFPFMYFAFSYFKQAQVYVRNKNATTPEHKITIAKQELPCIATFSATAHNDTTKRLFGL